MTHSAIEGFRLSPAQQHIWRLAGAGVPCAAYRAQCAVRIEGRLDRARLEASFTSVINRQEILRTTFRRVHGISLPLQVVEPERTAWTLVEHDLTAFEPSEQSAQLDCWLEEARRRTPNYAAWPLLETWLAKLSAEEYLLTVSLPSLCADAGGLRNLLEELARAYRGDARAESETDAEPPMQYADVAEWQNELLEEAEAGAGGDYWRRDSLRTLAPLRLDIAREMNWARETMRPKETSEAGTTGGAQETSTAQSFQRDVYSFELDARLDARLRLAVERLETTTEAFLFACWQTLLWRLASHPAGVVSLVCEGRKYAELRGVPGLFAKSLPIPLRCDAGLPFNELVAQLRELIQEAHAQQEYYTSDAAAADDAKRQESCAPFIPCSFELVEWPQPLEAGALRFSFCRLECCADRFHVKLCCAQRDAGIAAELQYDAALFRPAQVARLAEQFRTLVESAAERRRAPLETLEASSAAERRLMLCEWNDTRADYPRERCFQQLFEAQAARTPEAVAVVFEDERLTYGELDARADALAVELLSLGVGADVPVALCVERSTEMLTGLLGILKAGGAYVPLDPQYPAERLAFMLEDCGASVLVTQRRLLASLPEHGARVICLDAGAEAFDGARVGASERAKRAASVSPENLAYIIYTSGSTGRPKGVAVEHRQLSNYLQSIASRLELPRGGSYATVSTLAADLGNTMIFHALSTGGTLHVMSHERTIDARLFSEYLSRHAVDCLKIVPSHLAALLAAAERPEQILPRRRLILGGEAARRPLIEGIESLSPECRIFNHYGPTETTIGVLTFALEREPESRLAAATLPLGRPIANTQIYLLDARLQPVPLGARGELYVGGEPVTRGYLRRPELTAERFIPDPFSREPGARLYRTGDIARYLEDGDIEFLGRSDHQLKIRGYRVEPGEVEQVLSRHALVREAVVAAHMDAQGGARLVAYVVARGRETLSEESEGALRAFLQERLPEHMIPSVLLPLTALPLNANGKIDYAALPAPEQFQLAAESAPTPPRTPLEEVLARIWSEVLGVREPGVRSNFFRLGGNSLNALQIILRVRKMLQVELPATALFNAQTVEALGALVIAHETEKGQAERIASLLVSIARLSPADLKATLEEKRQAAGSASHVG